MTAKEYEQFILSLTTYGKPFSENDARLYLLQLAINGDETPSIRRLSQVFGWGKTKVAEFIRGQKTDKKRTLNTVTNNRLVAISGQKTDKKRTLEERRANFYNALIPYLQTYAKETIRAFYDYWSEPNPSMTKMRFEMEKTWNLSRRLTTWSNREKPKYYDKRDYQEQRQQQAADTYTKLLNGE